MRTFSLALIILVALLLAGCAGSSTQEAPSTTTGQAIINLVTNPDPAKVGDVQLRFTVNDSQGRPVTAADFDVFADHTDMSGMTMHGKATDQGDGLYSITANFSMTGNWKLSVEVKTDRLEHKQDFELKVQ
jgi:PBP1b-binding outer membrane lipoprotein LpoB